MKTRLFAVLSGTAVLLTGIVLLAGIAAAAPPAPTTPYPDVTIKVGVCPEEALTSEQSVGDYGTALDTYNKALLAVQRGVGAAQDLRDAQQALDNATIALINAKYAEATCQNNAAKPEDKDCVNLALELNRRIDKLAITQDLEAIAKDNYATAQALNAQNIISDTDLKKAANAYQKAQAQTKLDGIAVDKQRALTTAAECKDVNRPAPAPPPRPVTTPTDTPTNTDIPTTTDTPPTSTDTSIPVPTSY